MNRQEAEKQLQSTFQISRFYDKQWLTIEKLLQGERVLLIEKTGFGKSLCFQFPAIFMAGTTVVFSPLIALMRDQVKKLNALGIAAKSINSEQSLEENRQTIREAKEGKLKILYIAPERQGSTEWVEAAREIKLSMVVVDEAHCISVWGHDFRPAFKRIINLVTLLPKGLPVLATTATATPRVQADIEKQIGGNMLVLRGDLMRANFKLFVVPVQSEDEKLVWLGENIPKLPGTGLLYTGTRVETEIYSKWFEHLGVSTTAYNAGLDPESRIRVEQGLMNNEWKCIISTNALGMGIDKPDIRFILHTQIPQSPIHYYQEIGRAGRDGQTAYILLFYNPNDIKLPLKFIENGRPALSKYHRVIHAIQSDLLSEKELMKATNLKQNQFRVIKSDLLEQGIIREILDGRKKKYEFIPSSPPFNSQTFEELKKAKCSDLEQMVAYVETREPRMKFLCEFLGDKPLPVYNNCDNSGLKKIRVNISEDWKEKLICFREDYFPTLEVESKGSNLANGVAASHYGVTSVGEAIHRSKYENGGDFPDFLLRLALKALDKKFGQEKFDCILFIPPTVSGDLVKNFASKISQATQIPISHNLINIHNRKEQKMFENAYLKQENVSDSFSLLHPEQVKGKRILLIDDIFDSGASIKEAGKLLTIFGAGKISPLVIAKTVGGELV